MKTKNVVVTALMAVLVCGMAFASDPGTSKLIVVSQKPGVFRIIYEGTKAEKVQVKIYNTAGDEVYGETLSDVKGFTRPVNFDEMTPGEYTVEVSDSNGKHTQKLNYANETSVTGVHVTKMAGESRYLMAIANTGTETVNVRIFDGDSNLVHDQSIAINGDFGLVYNLKQVAGTPTFEVTDGNGNTKVIKQ